MTNITTTLRKLGLALTTTALVALAVGTAQAATDGLLGLSSIGTTDVTITKGDLAQITGMTNITLAPWNTGSPAPAGVTTACVYTSTGGYQVTASSANTSGVDFRLFDGALNFITYTMTYNDGVLGAQAMVSGSVQVGQTGDNVSVNCGGGFPATIAVGITVPNMNGAAAGAYSDTLTLLIAPE
jgi:hypothetical protein